MKIDRQVQAVESNEKIQSANCALKSEARLRVEMTQNMYPLSGKRVYGIKWRLRRRQQESERAKKTRVKMPRQEGHQYELSIRFPCETQECSKGFVE